MKKSGFKHLYYSSEDILLILDSYSDLFSDFDPRPYSEKSLSEDFLLECRKASQDKKRDIHIRFFLPKQKREPMDEIKIKKRMKEHFHMHLIQSRKVIEKIKVRGFAWFIAGSFLIIITALLPNQFNSILLKILINLAHPGGWFFLWEGLAKLLITTKEKRPVYEFYKKMVNSKISFSDYKK
ncbi:hypothetical protein A3K82_03240 [Candidatus Pacearchaeota archaeon RBG_19FT_COMBO_34_9]|nr:MAG: hypothetical protein A3K82_03240 [Candidatus Pacearchaeota archaeon RBG_19FT_COMBO_34_9]OGJ15928.1 MAG: hypothetical protein A3K74_02415 [Candidatus Pacearchaeota archaeon RBG_13_33_26]